MPLRDDLLTPIPGSNPSGESLRYNPLYDKIKDARREDDDAPQGDWQRERKTADFKTVLKLAGDALATKTKDLQLAVWLTEALLRTEGFAGLRQGVELCRGLLDGFWDTLYPEIEDGDLELRAAPLDWLGGYLDTALRNAPCTRSGLGYFKYKESRATGYEEQAAENETKRAAREAAIAEGKITAEDFDNASRATPTAQYETWVGDLDGALESLEALKAISEEKFGEYAPSYSKLQTGLEEVRQVVNSLLQKKLDADGRTAAPPPVDEPPVDEAPVSYSSGAAAAPARAPVRRAVSGIEPADADEAALRLAAVAKFLRQADPYSPAPYLMLRGFRWGELRALGESPDAMALVAPPTETRQTIKRLASESSWVELLEVAETAMAEPCGRAWLDLQRYVVTACETYGYPAIAAAIRSELKALLADLPGLPNWSLADDTPAANHETQAWLKEFVGQSASAPAELAPVMMRAEEPEEPGGEKPPDTFAMAMDNARKGRVNEAIELLTQEILLQGSGRGRFQHKLQLAQFCMATGHENLALPILQELAEEIDAHRLEKWESPDAVAQALVLLYRCLTKLDGESAERPKLFARICRLDPVQALACGK